MKDKKHLFILLLLPLLSACSQQGTPTSPEGLPSEVHYTAIGASDAIGFGSSVVCQPFGDCPDGKGYVQLIARHLQADGKKTTVRNLGIPGAVLSPEIESIGDSISLEIPANFIDSEGPFVDPQANVVTIFAGGNDANTIGSALRDGLGGSDPDGYLQTRVQDFGRDVQKLLDQVKQEAPDARIIVLNLPNVAGLPYANGLSVADRRTLQKIAVGLSAQMNKLTASGALIVDLMCDAGFYNPSLYSSDGFHPNDAGYQRLADVVYPVVTSGTASAPQASCAQMTLY